MENKRIPPVLAVIVSLAILACIYGIVTLATPTDPVPISTSALIRDYEANEIAANQNYRGQRWRIRGIVQGIGEGFGGKPYLMLTDSSEGAGPLIQATLTSGDSDGLSRLHKGSQVTVEGRVEGRPLSYVTVTDAKLVPY
jgi:hypothetical protein